MASSCFCRRSYFVLRGCLRVIAPVAQWRAGRCDLAALSWRQRLPESRYEELPITTWTDCTACRQPSVIVVVSTFPEPRRGGDDLATCVERSCFRRAGSLAH